MVCDASGKTVDADQLIDLLSSFETYTQIQRSSQSKGKPMTARAAATQFSTADQARDALRFICSSEGVVLRRFLLDEIVRGIDALSREGASRLFTTLRLDFVALPVVVPFAVRPLPLTPRVTEEDQRVVANISKLVRFLIGADVRSDASRIPAPSADVMREVVPVLPQVTAELLPEVLARLGSRQSAR